MSERPSRSAAFRPGQAISYRNRVRFDRSHVEVPSFVQAMTVIHDRPDELALLHRTGDEHARRNAVLGGPDHFRHKVVSSFLDGWTPERPWGHWRRILLKRPSSDHVTSVFIVEQTGLVDFWYIDISSPLERTATGFDFTEHGLDIVIKPDFSAWKWKDEDELSWSVDLGVYSRAEADELHAIGERAVAEVLADRERLRSWLDWRPDPPWAIAALPRGWDAEDGAVPPVPLSQIPPG